MSITPAGKPTDRLPWYGVAVVVVALVGIAVAILTGTAAGQRPAFTGDEVLTPEPVPAPDDGHLHLAGSGSNIPLVRSLATAYRAAGLQRPIVHASIGSGGGIRALLDGAIHIAMVSRPLGAKEEASGLVYVPIARIPVIVGAHLEIPEDGLRRDELVAIYRGEQTRWSDGSPIFVFQREPGDSSHLAVDSVLEGFEAANEAAYTGSTFHVLYHDSTMQSALSNTSGAIGLHGNGVTPDLVGFKALAIDGVVPSIRTLENGTYPFSKTLALVTREHPPQEVVDFLAFVKSDAGQAAIRETGAVAL